MAHLPPLLHDLALILMAAGIVTLLFRKLGQPVVLGYIIAGLLVGPHVPIVPNVADLPNVQIWAEIGVIFLLFALGLEFSFKKLMKVGGAASITAFIEVSGMTIIGYLAGKAFGWSGIDSLFLGGILAISSTTIIIRAFEELGVKGRGFANLVFGILIVEDLFAILLLVLLSAVAVQKGFDGAEMIFSITKLVFFVVAWFLSGVFFLPTIFRKIRRNLNEETLLVVSIGLCFFMVVITTKAGFSPALGAFMMGSILAETADASRIEHLIKPVKDLFGAIFFVSVGMLIDPRALYQHAWPIAILTLVTVGGKILTTFIGAMISGRNVRQSVQSGMSLAQIGEFSFIIAGLGLTLKVTSDFLYPIAVGVSAITTFTTPYLIRSADSFAGFVTGILPVRIKHTMDTYSSSTQKVSSSRGWKELLGSYGLLVLVNAVIITAIFLTLARLLPGILDDYFTNTHLIDTLGLMLATLACSPFFWALLVSRPKKDEAGKLWTTTEYRSALRGLELLRFLFAMALFGLLSAQFIELKLAAGVTAILALGSFFLFSRQLNKAYSWLEAHVIENLSDNKEGQTLPNLAPWDAHLSSFVVAPNSEVVGKTLEELKVRERFGVTIALIHRGHAMISAPGRLVCLFPEDRVSVIGTDEQMELFAKALHPGETETDAPRNANYGLHSMRIIANMSFAGKTIRNSGLREQTDGLVVGLEREGKRFLNPDSTFELRPGDLLWIVGDRERILAIQ